MAKVHGRAFIEVGGEHVASLPGAALEPGGEEYDAKMSDRGYAGVQCTGIAPSRLKFKVYLGSSTDPEKIRAWIEVGAKFESDAGVTYRIAKTTRTKVPELATEMEVECVGTPAEKV